jgi:hypothetical protein
MDGLSSDKLNVTRPLSVWSGWPNEKVRFHESSLSLLRGQLTRCVRKSPKRALEALLCPLSEYVSGP